MTSIMKDSQCGTYNYMAPEAIKSSSPVGANQEYKVILLSSIVITLDPSRIHSLRYYVPHCYISTNSRFSKMVIWFCRSAEKRMSGRWGVFFTTWFTKIRLSTKSETRSKSWMPSSMSATSLSFLQQQIHWLLLFSRAAWTEIHVIDLLLSSFSVIHISPITMIALNCKINWNLSCSMANWLTKQR